MWKKVLMFALSSGLAASAWRQLDQRRRQRRALRQRQLEREQLGRWEDEGGALPTQPQVPSGPPR